MLGLGLSLTRAALHGSVLSAFSAAKYAIAQNTADVNILVIGDSTGDAVSEWVYLMGEWLAGEYPTHSVSYRLWDNGGGVYAAAIPLGTGSGVNTIHIWNASLAGSRPSDLLGLTFSSVVTATDAAVVIWNHGHNMTPFLSSSGVIPGPSLVRGGFLEAMESVRLSLPSAAHIAIAQNPNRDDGNMAPIVDALGVVSGLYGDLHVIDVYTKFIAEGKNPALYTDNIHPSAAGQALFVEAVQSAWKTSPQVQFTVAPAFLLTKATNILPSADFSNPAYVGGVPAGWSNNAGTETVETTIVDAGKSQSLKMTGVAANSAMLCNNVAAVKGKRVTLAVRVFIPAGSTTAVGTVNVRYNDGATVIANTYPSSAPFGVWVWRVISGFEIPANSVSASVTLYCNLAANVDSASYYDRAILVEGYIPRDMT